MSLAPPASRPRHATRTNGTPSDCGKPTNNGKPRPAFGPAINSRRLVITALVVSFVLLAAAAGPLKLRRRLRGRPQRLIVRNDKGDVALNCTAARGAVGRLCLASQVHHSAAATNASRAETERSGALTAHLPGVHEPLPDPVAVTFYDDPIGLQTQSSAGGSAVDGECPELTPPDGAPTVFAARDNPSLYHLLRVQLLPIFLALASFGLQDGAFQIVFTDSRPRDWSTYVFDEASGHPVRLLQQMPPCFGVRRAVLGVRYDTFGISAHKAATEAETASARPQLTAFAAWLLRRFGASHAAKPELFESKAHRGGVAAEMPAAAAEQIDGAASRPPEPAASAKAAFAEPADTAACGRLRALPQRPLLTVVLRTSKRNGNGRRLVDAKHLTWAAEACGFATTQVDMAALRFAQQVQAVANSSVLIGVHGGAMTLLLALPPWGVSVELQPYKFDESAQYYHVFGNYAAAAARTHFRWHNTNPWHASAGVARVDDYKNHDVRLIPAEAKKIVAAAAAALVVPPEQREFSVPVLLNAPRLRCNYSGIMGNLRDDCAALDSSSRG